MPSSSPTDALESSRKEELKLLQASVRSFCKKEVAPYVRKWDEVQELPRRLFEAMGELGLMGMLVPTEYEGSGMDYLAYTLSLVELAKVDPSVALSVAAHNSLCVGHILTFGTESQKRRYLPDLCSGKKLGAWALTEPNSGSDAANMKTMIVRNQAGWSVTGTKNFITHGNSADVLVLLARSADSSSTRNTRALILERDTEGLLKGRKEDKLGMRASETAEVILQDCQVTEEQFVSKVGEGIPQAMQVLDGGRISIAALSVGIAEGAYQLALQYAKERHQFGKPISSFQGISFKLADMYTELQASKALLQSVVTQKDKGHSSTKSSSIAKYYTSEQAVRIAEECVQVLGGYGYIKEFPAEKFYRDAKLCTIGEGTSEIQKLIIVRELLKEY